MNIIMRFVVLVMFVVTICLSEGCGRFRGITTHGGGKRFYIEQELIAATARATAKDIDIAPLIGKRCALYVVLMGDEGSGNIAGGRYALDAIIKGSYQVSPTQRTRSEYPVYDSLATVRDSAGALTQTTDTTGNVLNAPGKSDTQTRGGSQNYSGGATLSWPGTYQAAAFINPRDAQFLNAVIHEALTLKGVLIVPPQQADIDIYVTVDAFGTCHDRFEYLITNKEVLTAKTALSICAFDRRDGSVVLPPTTSAFEAEYRQRFLFWCGPFSEKKSVYPAGNLLIDFKDIALSKRVSGSLPDIQDKSSKEKTDIQRTRPNILISPVVKPDPSRTEDVLKQ